MGCCQSKSDDFSREEDYIPQSRIDNTNNHNSSNNQQQQSVPPIVITKAHSVASADSSLPASTSANPTHPQDKKQPLPEDTQIPLEKPPVIIEERTQEHSFGEPPVLDEPPHIDAQATIKQVHPVVINNPETIEDPTLIPAISIPEAKKAAVDAGLLPSSESSTPSEVISTISPPNPPSASSQQQQQQQQWPILVRHNTSSKDTLINIPTVAPFMTVADVKRKIPVEPGQQIKLIHLGRILQDDFTLVPSNSEQSTVTKNVIKVSSHGVIQAMIYKM